MRLTFMRGYCTAVVLFHSIASSHTIPARELESSAKRPEALKVETLVQFPNSSWAENLAVRSNGQILVDRYDIPIVVQVDPEGKVAPVTVATFPSTYAGVLGITETINDFFYVLAVPPVNSSWMITGSASSAVFEVNMNTFKLSSSGAIKFKATVKKIADIKGAQVLNGAVTLDANRGLIFMADSTLGVVWRLDVHTGNYSIAFNDPKMKPLRNAELPLGVNGVKIHDGYLYWTNTGNPIFSRIPINTDSEVTGPSEVVATPISGSDDFVFGSDGTAWIMGPLEDEINTVNGQSITTVVGGNTSAVLVGTTAAVFGRLPEDKNRLYITTDGDAPVGSSNTTERLGAKLAYIDTKPLC